MRFLKFYTLPILTLVVGGLFLMPACKNVDPDVPVVTEGNLAKSHPNNVVYDWNELFLEVERYAAGYRPGPAPRALAYLGIADYEGCITGMPGYHSIAPLYAGLVIPQVESGKQYHWPTVINASHAYMMPRFFINASAAQLQAMTGLEALYDDRAKQEVGQEVWARSKDYGKAVATAVWEYTKTDVVGHNHFLDPFQGYDWTQHYSKDGDWKPTFPGPGKPMGGVWGGARTFAISESEKICRKPLPYSASPTSDLYSQAVEVYAQNTPSLSYEDEWVGEYWSDDLLNLTFSPGPRWLAIGDEALKLENSNLETAIFMSVKMGMALNDAAVGCWKSKFVYNVERPQTYINRVIDANWKPALYNPMTGDIGVTPSFPAYPSGHSTMGGAGAEILGDVFGYAYAMTDKCHEGRTEFEGVPRSFGSFYEMAQENAWSRVPLGVHFRMDCDEGVRFGTVIGRKVNDLPWKN
ncbi:MAG: vanadium-dependent haloperoxidase [Phycisphaerae bacterium]|nr:vanadium-dependent haloperoxidase [Saprospiraceae bacterium]